MAALNYVKAAQLMCFIYIISYANFVRGLFNSECCVRISVQYNTRSDRNSEWIIQGELWREPYHICYCILLLSLCSTSGLQESIFL